MKKLFLIPLMTLCTCVMAWATDAHVSTIADLNAKLADASVETIYLDADLTYAGEDCINIMRSVVIDGQGHTLKGQGVRTGSTYSSLAINQGAPNNANWIDSVALKNLTIENTKSAGQALNVRCNLSALLIDNCEIITTNAGGNSQPITFGGNQSTPVKFYVYDSKVLANNSGYPVITFNPIHLVTANSTYSGYCGLYFKGVSSSAGSRGSVVNATNCNFDCPNVHSGVSNAFSCFPLEDDGIILYLHNCGMNIEEIGDQNQALVTTNNNNSSRREQPINITISGDNSHFNIKGGFNKTIQNLYLQGSYKYQPYGDINVTLSGGTYSVNPESMCYYNQWVPVEEGTPTQVTLKYVTIADGYEVQEVKQGDVTLYRITKVAAEKTPGVLYNLNELVVGEGVAEGNNPVSSFELADGTSTTLINKTTTAGYVEIKDNGTTGTTVTVGQTAGGENQTLVINNGLDVQGNSQVIVESGATLQIGEGGINTEHPENIIIEANENGAASVLLDPTITVNQTPNLTVKMTAKQIGRKDGDFYWHRFAMPVAHIENWEKEGSLAPSSTYPTYVYAWDYTANAWKSITPKQMDPLQGYTLTLASNWINSDGTDAETETGTLNVLQDVVYTFKGNLVGNTDQALDFQEEGFNYFGNSYTGYMDVKTVLEGLEDGNIDGTAYMWCNDPDDEAYQTYVGVSLYKLQKGRGLEEWMKEVAPMQTFILRLRGADSADESINYASAIWGNPRYGNNSAGVAPRRAVASVNEDTYMEISVKAANGKSSTVDFTESAANSDAFESGYDVEKYMNEKTINLYATINGVNHSSVVTNNIEGKTLSLKTNAEIAYTMSFKNVEGEAYAIRDNATGAVVAIEEGAIYEFAAQPNSTVEGRFEILPIAKMPTAIENTEVKANVKGIYTIMGQYLGEDFDVLPAGVYVVNGVKIVK